MEKGEGHWIEKGQKMRDSISMDKIKTIKKKKSGGTQGHDGLEMGEEGRW